MYIYVLVLYHAYECLTLKKQNIIQNRIAEIWKKFLPCQVSTYSPKCYCRIIIFLTLFFSQFYSSHNLFFSIQFTLIFSILRLRYFSHRRFMWFPLFNFHTYLWKVYLKICAESWIFKYSSNLNLFFSIKGTIDRSVISSFLLIYIYYEANWWYVTKKNAFSWMQTTDMQKVCTT